MKEKVLALLRESDSYRSGEEISALLQVSRTTVWKHIRQLRKEGHQIDAATNKGYFLRAEADQLSEAAILDALQRHGLADWLKQVVYVPQTDSTNQLARTAAGKGNWERVLFITANQLAGRGRRGKSWHAEPDRDLTFSLLSRPDITAQDIAPVTLFAGLCAAMALNAYLKQKAVASGAASARPGTSGHAQPQRQDWQPAIGIKWPNDLVSVGSGKKLGGVLLETVFEESRMDALIMGIGINVNSIAIPDELKMSATSILLETGRPGRRLDILCHMLSTLRQYETQMTQRNNWLPLYRELCLTLNRPVRLLQANGNEQLGQAIDIDQNGELIILDCQGNRQTVRSGEVSVRGLLGYAL